MYADAIRVWNRRDQRIIDTADKKNGYFNPSSGNAQTYGMSLMLRTPDRPNLVHYFHSNVDTGTVYNDAFLRYTIFELSYQNDSAGPVQTQKRKPIGSFTRMLTATKHTNGRDYWIIYWGNNIVTGLNDSYFNAMLLDSSGIDTTHIMSKAPNDLGALYTHSGVVKISHDGRSIVVTGLYDSLFFPDAVSTYLFDFDNKTGKISNPKPLLYFKDHQNTRTYGAEFSPNDSFIYISTLFKASRFPKKDEEQAAWLATNYLLQVNRFTGKKQVIHSFRKKKPTDDNSALHEIFGIQMGADNKIYFVYSDQAPLYIGVIHRPDELGKNCNAELKAYSFTGLVSGYLPNVYMPLNTLKFRSNLFETPCRDTAEFRAFADSNYLSLTWYFGDGDSLVLKKNEWHKDTTIKHKYSNPGNYYVKILGVKNDCNYVVWYGDSVLVSGIPRLDSMTFDPLSLCKGGELKIKDYPAYTRSAFVYYGDGQTDYGSPDTNGLLKFGHTYMSEDTFHFSIKLSNEYCETVFDTTLKIEEWPHIVSRLYSSAFRKSQSDSICVGSQLVLSDTFANLKNRIINWGDGSQSDGLSMVVTHSYSDSGLYNITFFDTSVSRCPFSDSFPVYVWPKPVWKYDLKDTTFCLPFSLTLRTGTQYVNESYNWSDLTNQLGIETTNSLIWSKAGILEASVTNICGTQRDTIIIKRLEKPTLKLDTLYDACENISLKLDINNPKNEETYLWSTTETTPTITTTKAGNYWAKAMNYCGEDSVSFKVVLYPKPMPDFSITDVCEGERVPFHNKTTGGKTFEWRFGDGTISTDSVPSKQYAITKNSRTYFVTLVAQISKGCQDSISKSLNVNATSDAGFTHSSQGKTVFFTQTATEPGESYRWYFGDGDSSTETNPTHLYKADSGTYNVCLNILNAANCKSQVCRSVRYSVGINEVEKNLFSVYPNPTDGTVHLEFSSLISNVDIFVSNLLGESVLSKSDFCCSETTIDMGHLSQGVYLIRIIDTNKSFMQRIVLLK
jgi:PKD repeat protein